MANHDPFYLNFEKCPHVPLSIKLFQSFHAIKTDKWQDPKEIITSLY